MEAMGRLREKHLNLPLDAVLHPASSSAQQAARDEQTAAGTAPAVQEKELTAQRWFEQGFNAADLAEKLRYYNQAIRLKPDYVDAYNNRGVARRDKGDLDGALQDYGEAIRLKPDYATAYYNRARIWAHKAHYPAAIGDLQKYLDVGGGMRDGDQAEVEQTIRDLMKKL